MERDNTRIALISEHASPLALLGGQDAGGQNVYVDEVSRNLVDLGYSIDVFTRRESRDIPEVIEWAPDIRIINLTAGPLQRISKDDMWPYMPEFRDAFLRFIVRDGAGYDLIHGNFWMSGWVTVDLGHHLSIPTVQIFHALGTTKRQNQGDADTSPPDRIDVEREIVRRIDRVVAQCPHEQQELLADYDADPRKIAMIPGAVNTDRFRPVNRVAARRRIGLETDEPVVVYVGRLLPRKGIRTLVEAFAKLTRAVERGESGLDRLPRLLIVGGESPDPDPVATPEIGVLQRMAANLGIGDRVQFTGQEQPDDLRFYYGAADVTVTTPWYEPFGLTPLEAMACGRPVIGSAVGGITFTINDGQTGFLVPPHDPEALSMRMEFALSHPKLMTRMGQDARQRVEREFTWPIVAQRLDLIYRSLLGQIEHRQRIPSTRTTPFSLLPTLEQTEALGNLLEND